MATDRAEWHLIGKMNAAKHEDEQWHRYGENRRKRWCEPRRLETRASLMLCEALPAVLNHPFSGPWSIPSVTAYRTAHVSAQLQPLHYPPRTNSFAGKVHNTLPRTFAVQAPVRILQRDGCAAPAGPHHALGAVTRDSGDFRTDAERLCDVLWFGERAKAHAEGRAPQRSPEMMALDFDILKTALARGPITHYDVEGAPPDHNAALRELTLASKRPSPPLTLHAPSSFCTCDCCRPRHTTVLPSSFSTTTTSAGRTPSPPHPSEHPHSPPL